jgi:hypothetical protein
MTMPRWCLPAATPLVLALAFALPSPAQAELRPHRAEYSLRLGTAANSPRIGKAAQELALDCEGWHSRRDVEAAAAITPSLQVKVLSILTGDEDRAGNRFHYRAVVTQNGARQETRGSVRRDGEEARATIEAPDGSHTTDLPSSTLMPLAAVGKLVERLAAGESTFSLVMFTAEGAGEALRFDVKPAEPRALPSTPPSEAEVTVPAGKSWAVAMTVTRAGDEERKPLMTVRAQVFDTGVLDRLVIDAGIVTVTAYLRSLQMAEMPDCARR